MPMRLPFAMREARGYMRAMTSGEPALDQFLPGHLNKDGIRIHSAEDFAGMRTAGRLAADILDRIAPTVAPGVGTAEIDAAVLDMIREAGAASATIGYKGYRHATCISLNHVVCHGIPGDQRAARRRHPQHRRDGDRGRLVRRHSPDVRRRGAGAAGRAPDRRHPRRADGGHAACRPATPSATSAPRSSASPRRTAPRWSATSAATASAGCSTPPPNVLHYGRWGSGPVLEPGMFFTVEPMINLGRPVLPAGAAPGRTQRLLGGRSAS